MKITHKAVAQLFFTASRLDDSCWVCNKCRGSKRCSKGYTNLSNHAKSCYGANFEKEIIQHLESNGIQVGVDSKGNYSIPKDINQNVLTSFYSTNDKEKRAYQWMRWLSSRNMPISEITNEVTAAFSKYKGFSRDTIRKYIIATADEAAKNISAEMKEAGIVSLLFDGWTCDGTATHYIGIFAGYIDPKTGERKEVLLAVQPTLEEDDLGADAHIALLESTLEYYGLSVENVVCIIGDNCSTNRAISKRWKVPLIGCFNHKLNLAVELWIKEQRGLQEAIDAVSNLMSKASNLKAAARLRDLTMDAHGKCLSAKKHNETRWTSVFDMCKRYLRIKPQLQAIEGLVGHFLTVAQNKIIKSVMEDFEVFRSVTVEIQAAGIDVLHARTQFDTILEAPKYFCMEQYLAPDADIIESPAFESGIVKIQQGLPLNKEEAEACKKLLKPKEATDDSDDDEEEPEEHLTVMERLNNNRKKRKLSQTTRLLQYVDVSKLIVATSNCCERLFSEAKYIMVPHRRKMSPLLFESLIFLKKNQAFWNVRTVAAAIRKSDNDDAELNKRLERDDDAFYD